MTVEEHLRAEIKNIPIESNILENALAESYKKGFRLISLDDDYYEVIGDKVLSDSLDYALSCLLYTASGESGWSSRSEQVGDVKASVSSGTIDWDIRNQWIKKANAIREALGFEPEEVESEQGGLFDANDPSLGLRNRYPQYFKPTWRWN